MSKQNTPTGLFSPSKFSFGKLLTPKTKQTIDFDSQPSQPSQSGTPTVKKSGLEAYAKKNKLSLPPDFSDLVLECEMELEKDEVSIEAITKLTDLYSQAMAFYEAEGNHKHKYFAKKLQDLMLKPNVKETMVREIAPVKSVEDDKELRRMRLESQVSKVNTEKEAFTLVKTHENKEKEIKRVLNKDLTSQRDRIQKKLAERKAKVQSRAQSMTYISDENSSTTEEAQNEAEKDIDSSPKAQAHKLIKIEEADEADENRYGTPPRRRSKDGQMIFYFPKGKKNLKKLFLEELAQKSEEVKKVARHARRYSENKLPVLSPITPVSTGNGTAAAKRVGRAQSFCTRNALPTIVDKARKISSNSLDKDEESKNESPVAKSLSGIGKDDIMDLHSMMEKKEDEKVKSNNTVEETDEESKNEGSSKSSVAPEEEEQGKENNQEGQGKVEESAQVGEKEVVVGSLVVNEEVSEEVKEVVVEIAEQEKEGQVEKVEEVIVEVVEKKEGENVAEIVEVVKVEEIVKEEEVVVEKVEVKEEVVENVVQENKESEVVVEQQEEKIEEVVEVQEQVVESVQEEKVQEEKPVEEVTEVQATETMINNVEDVKAEEVVQVEAGENSAEVQEEAKIDSENIAQIQEAVVEKEEAANEEDEEVLMVRKIDEENKVLLEEFLGKQEKVRQDASKQIEQKYAKKLEAMEEDMEPDEKLSMMWQKAVAKINKDKENEIQKVLEGLIQEHSQEAEKYKKKLQQQKMFKLAELSS